MPDNRRTIGKLGDLAADAGIHRLTMLAWRDLDDPEAGGSELHAAKLAALWAEAGLEVTMRTSYAAGRPQTTWRDGYRVIRKAGRYLVFPRAALSEFVGWHGRSDGLIEIWNGMPFFSPLWSRTPHVAIVHHVHAEMWQMTLPARLAALGNFIESRLAPPIYRRTPICTLSESSKRELVEDLGFKPGLVTVTPPGVERRFSPDGEKSPVPLVVAVGRLVPVKRFGRLVDALLELKPAHPHLQAVIAGEGYERDDLEAQLREAKAEDWIHLPGRISDDDLLALYRRAWVVASMSAREGWGMTITEAAGCGTPAVATRIAGHLDAVNDGRSGVIVDGHREMVAALDRVLRDRPFREQLSAGALVRVSNLTWDATAYGVLSALAIETKRHRRAQA